MPIYPANIVPVVAKIQFNPEGGDFRMRVSTQYKRPDGTKYEVDIETSVDLGALITLLLNIWTGASYGPGAQTAMAYPSAVVVPAEDAAQFASVVDVGTAGDVGTADPADDLVDADLI